jgi:hypothetical protein
VKPSPSSTAPDASEKEAAYQAHVDALKDQLLLFIRDGAWCKVRDLAAWLAPRLAAEFTVHRYTAEGGLAGKKFDHKCGEGQKLALKDILDVLGEKKLVALRTVEAGEEEVQSTPWTDDRFDVDSEFKDLLPRAPDEVKKLEERLLIEEARDPLVVWKGHRKLVDGHTRFRFFALLGRSYPVVEMDFLSREAVKTWLLATHYGRRSYSAEMKAYVRGTDYLTRKKQHGGAREKASSQSGNLKTADAVAAEYGTGRNTILRDAAFAEGLDAIAGHCGDGVRQAVLSRVAKWTRRDVERLANLDKAALQEIVQAALAAGRRPRFPPPAEGKGTARKSVSLPMGKPVEQVRVLRKILGGKGLAQLQQAIVRFFEKQKRSQSI